MAGVGVHKRDRWGSVDHSFPVWGRTVEHKEQLMILTEDERRKFVEYLEQDAMSNDLLAKQMDTMPSMGAMAKKKRTLALAQALVAKELGGWESQTIT